MWVAEPSVGGREQIDELEISQGSKRPRKTDSVDDGDVKLAALSDEDLGWSREYRQVEFIVDN